MQPREKRMVAITAVALALGLFVDQVYAPLRDRREAAEEMLYQLEGALGRDEVLALRAPGREAERRQVFEALPEEGDPKLGPEILSLIQNTARKAGVEVHSVGRQSVKDLETAGLREVLTPVEMRQVAYDKLVAFLRGVREAKGLVKIASMRITVDTQNRLSVSLRLATLVRGKPAAGEGAL